MKFRTFALPVGLTLGNVTPARSQDSHIDQLLADPNRQREVINAIANNHTLVMKLIDRLSAHPHFMLMMKERFNVPAKAESQTS